MIAKFCLPAIYLGPNNLHHALGIWRIVIPHMCGTIELLSHVP